GQRLPGSVILAVVALGYQGVILVTTAVTVTIRDMHWWGSLPSEDMQLAATSLMLGICSWVVMVGAARRRAWGWAGAMGLLYGKSAVAALALLVIGAAWSHYPPGVLPGVLLYAAGVGVLTTCLFRARPWYGIGRREGWRALFRKG